MFDRFCAGVRLLPFRIKSFIVQRRFLVSWLLGLSFLFTLVFDLKVEQVAQEFGYGIAGLSFVSAWLMSFAFMLGAYALHWMVLWLFLWVGSVCLFTITWMLRFSGLELNDEIVAVAMEASWQEIFIYFNWISGPAVLLFGFGLFIFTRYLAKHDTSTTFIRYGKCKLIGFAAGIIAVLNICYYRGLPYNMFMPTSIQTALFSDAAKFPMRTIRTCAESVQTYFTDTKQIKAQLERLQDPALEPSSRTQTSPVTIVIHWGESLRADHLPMNGYERNTMPKLSQRDVVSFPKTVSFGTQTRESTLGAFSAANFKDRRPVYSGFMGMFNKHGFQTHAVVLPQGSVHDMPAFYLLKDTQHIVQMPFAKIFDISASLPEILGICGGGGGDRVPTWCSTLII